MAQKGVEKVIKKVLFGIFWVLAWGGIWIALLLKL